MRALNSIIKCLIYKYLIFNFSRKYRDKHKGEVFYIFGDGPSVKWFDIKEFSNLNAISVNWFIFHKDFIYLNIKYCTLAEPWALMPRWLRPSRENLSGIKHITKRYKQNISEYPHIKFFVHFSNLTSIFNKQIDILPKTVVKKQKESGNPKIDFFKGSFYTALSLAYIMGFSKVFLIGFDAYTLRPVRHGHWYEYGEGVLSDWTENINEFVKFISRKVEIVAISKDSSDTPKCDDIKIVSYKDFTGKDPTYNENIELLSKNNFDLLSSYKGYKIKPEYLFE